MERITAIGEILFDIYPETRNLGGAPFNFLYHTFKFTGRGNIISRVGNDVLGKNAKEFLKNNDIPVDYVQIDHLHPTGVTTVVLNEEKVPSFIIDEKRAYDFIESTSAIEKLIEKETDCLYFGSLAQRNDVSRNTIQSLMGKKIKYFCDLNIRQNFYNKEILFQSLKNANAVKLNLDELKLLHKIFLEDHFDLYSSSKLLMKKFDIEMLAVTKGDEGSVLCRGEETDEHKTEMKNVIDTVGAGDAFASILCLGYLNKWDLKKINRLANDFAAEICMINGALPKDDKIYERYKKEIEG